MCAVATACGGGQKRTAFDRGAFCYSKRDYACVETELTRAIQSGINVNASYQLRARARLDAGNRIGALEDADALVRMTPNAASYSERAAIRSDIKRARELGAWEPVISSANPKLDLHGAWDDLTKCIALTPRNPSDPELDLMAECYHDRADVAAGLGRNDPDDMAQFKRVMCGVCSRGSMCDPASGCQLNLGTSSGGGGRVGYSGGGGGYAGGGGGGGGAWYYSWSCSGQCAPGNLGASGTEGPFPSQAACDAARSSDSRQQLVLQSGNFGNVGYCEQR